MGYDSASARNAAESAPGTAAYTVQGTVVNTVAHIGAPGDARDHGSRDGSRDHGMYVSGAVETAVKILVVGHFGVGKTTFIGALSEIPPLRTEEMMTQPAAHLDDLSGVPDKRTTTVALDFGRLTLSEQLVLYLFGTPGQERFRRVWEDTALGALGALLLVDPARLADSFPVIDLLEMHGLDFAVAVNEFDPGTHYAEAELRQALDLLPEVPIVYCDAHDPRSSGQALIALVQYLLTQTP